MTDSLEPRLLLPHVLDYMHLLALLLVCSAREGGQACVLWAW